MKNSLDGIRTPVGTAQIAEINLAERVALLLPDAARRVVAEKHLMRIVDALDLVHQYEEPLAFGKHNQLRPARSSFATGCGILIPISCLDRDEVCALDDVRLYGFHTVAELRALDDTLPMAAAVGHESVGLPSRLVLVPSISANAMPIRGNHLIAIIFVASHFHKPIDDHQAVANFSEAGGLVEKRSFFDAGHPVFGVLLGNDGFEFVSLDFEGVVVLAHVYPLGVLHRIPPLPGQITKPAIGPGNGLLGSISVLSNNQHAESNWLCYTHPNGSTNHFADSQGMMSINGCRYDFPG